MPKPRIHKAARLEVLEATNRYREEGRAQHNEAFGKQLAAEFRAEVRRSIDTILERPMQWPTYGRATRRRILEKFPFSIIYLIEMDGRVHILALAHHSREPGYWRDRS